MDPSWPADGRALRSALANFQMGASPTIVTDRAGGSIVAWHDKRGGKTSTSDIYAQHALASGAVDSNWPTDGRALCTAANDQYAATSVADGAGGAIVAWQDERGGSANTSDIYAQHVLASGAVDPAWPPDGRDLCTAANAQSNPTILTDGAGGAIVTWMDLRSGGGAIYSQHVLASGAVDPAWPINGRALCTTPANFQNSAMTVTDGAGGAILTWEDGSSIPDSLDIYTQHLLANGTVDPAWPASGRAPCTAAHEQSYPTIVADGAGGAIVTWMDLRSSTSIWDNDIYTQRVGPSGQLGSDCGSRNEVVSFTPGWGTSLRDAWQSVGPPDGRATPLGYLGSVVIHFPCDMVNDPGSDIRVYELGNNVPPAINENYRVEASADGASYFVLGTAPGGIADFDLGVAGLSSARYLRVTDLPPREQTGNFDPTVVGADIDAVVALHTASREVDCSDGIDNDGDGLVDCADPDCHVDADGDGFWASPCGSDCHDRNAAVHPGAAEICGNGIDDDCNGKIDCADATCSWSALARPFACDDPCNARSEFCQNFEWIGGAAPDPDRNFDVVIGGDSGRIGTAYLASGLRSDALRIVADFSSVPAYSLFGSRISFWLDKQPTLVPRSSEETNDPGFGPFFTFLAVLDRYHLEYATFRTIPPPGAPTPYGGTINGKWSFYGPAPSSDHSVTALHELGHGFSLRDEYHRATCSTAQPFQAGNPVPNVLRDQADCEQAVAYFANCGVSGDCVRVCDVGRAWRLNVVNLMQAAKDCAPCSPLMGYGPLGDLHIRQIVERVVTPCFAPNRASAPLAMAGTASSVNPLREARIRLHLQDGQPVDAEIAIVPDSGVTTIPGGDPAYLQMLNHDGQTLGSVAIWNPAVAEVGGEGSDIGSAVREYRLPHVNGAAEWRLVNVDESIGIRRGTGAALLDYCRSVNYTDLECWQTDSDGDSIPDLYDNCPTVSNPDQADLNANGIGDACESAVDVSRDLPAAERISAVMPNPMRGLASLRMELPARASVRVTVHDLAGRLVRSLAQSSFDAGVHTLTWDGRSDAMDPVDSGVYFCRLTIDGRVFKRTIVLVR